MFHTNFYEIKLSVNVIFIHQSNFGAVSLNYTLSDQPVYGKFFLLLIYVIFHHWLNFEFGVGNWTIRVQALHQIEEKQFYVEEYYQPRFEVRFVLCQTLSRTRSE